MKGEDIYTYIKMEASKQEFFKISPMSKIANLIGININWLRLGIINGGLSYKKMLKLCDILKIDINKFKETK